MHNVNQRILTLVSIQRQATNEALQQSITHVARAPLSLRPVKMTRWLRQELAARGVRSPSAKLPSVDIHLLQRMHLDWQWPAGTTVEQCLADLPQAVQHPEVQVWTSRWLGEACAGFLSPAPIQHVPTPEVSMCVAYSADHGVIRTGFQASSPEAVCAEGCAHLTRQREGTRMDLQVHGPKHSASCLLNSAHLVQDLAEVAAAWPNLDEEERGHHRAELCKTWGHRKVLGLLLQARRLPPTQAARFADLDRLLLTQAAHMAHGFGLDLGQLLAILRWGTPLSTSAQSVRIEVAPTSLDRLATACTSSHHD